MKDWVRRIRGAIGMGVTWATGWGLVGGAFGLALAVLLPSVFGLGVIAQVAGVWAGAGFLGGAVFSSVLRLADGRRRFDELSLARFAALGGMGGGLVGAVMWGAGDVLAVQAVAVGIGTLLGAASAAGALVIARRADDMELLESSEDVAEVGLTEEDRKQLLGT